MKVIEVFTMSRMIFILGLLLAITIEVALATPPRCNGIVATIYVGNDSKIVGGKLDGQYYRAQLLGTNNNDVIVGTKGHDIIKGYKGEDLICGGAGNDEIRGGNHIDTIYGEAGHDLIIGGRGGDTLIGGAGDDKAIGKGGENDSCDAETEKSCELNIITPPCEQLITFYFDADNDAFGDENTMIEACTIPTGYASIAGDCDDQNNSINPSASEILGDGIDQNCNGIIDEE